MKFFIPTPLVLPSPFLQLPTHSLFSISFSKEAIFWLAHLFLTLFLLKKVMEGNISILVLGQSDSNSKPHPQNTGHSTCIIVPLAVQQIIHSVHKCWLSFARQDIIPVVLFSLRSTRSPGLGTIKTVCIIGECLLPQ